MTFTPAMLARLTATDSAAGPIDAADLIQLLHGAGMTAAAWRLESSFENMADLEAEIENFEAYVSPEDHAEEMKAAGIDLENMQTERDDLQKQLDAIDAAEENLAFDPVRALARMTTGLAEWREIVTTQRARIQQLEAAAKLAGKRKRKAK